jgi:hypothetical protein
MNWHVRLAERRSVIFTKGPDDSQPKLTKPGFVGFVSRPDDYSGNIAPVATSAIRTRLLALTNAEGIDNAIVRRLSADDLAACEGLPDSVLRVYVLALRDTALREQGLVPADETAAIHCARCGPVWAHPAVAAVLPVVDSWPRAAGCPWCHIRKAGRDIPRPPVCCGDCANFTLDNVNPSGGMGHCAAGCKPSRPWPNVIRSCKSFAQLRTV